EWRAGGDALGEIEADRLRVSVVATDECVLVGRLRPGQGRRSERVQTCDDGRFELVLDALGERSSLVVRQDANLREAELRGNRENGRVANDSAQLSRGVERGVGVDREDDEVGVGARLVVRLTHAVE